MARAKSKARVAQLACEEKDALMARATALYIHEQDKDLQNGEKRMSLRAVCKPIEGEHLLQKKKAITLDPNTLLRHVKGGKAKSKSNEEKGWLLPEEVETVIAYAVEVANRGFPLTHRWLKEVVDEICSAQLGNKFPSIGVGKKWTGHFVEKHRDRLRTYWSHSLDNKRGHAVNPATNTAWFDLLEDVLAGRRDGEFDSDSEDGDTDGTEYKPILLENVYGMDESGSPASTATKRRAIGGAGKKTQHQTGDGGRENTTVILTICADGTALKPSVIFKGQAYNVRWDQENPTNAL
jgi:hypothetical protein